MKKKRFWNDVLKETLNFFYNMKRKSSISSIDVGLLFSTLTKAESIEI